MVTENDTQSRNWAARAVVLLVLVVGCAAGVAMFMRSRARTNDARSTAAASASGSRANLALAGSAIASHDPLVLGIEAAFASEPDTMALVHRYMSPPEGDMLWPIQVGVILAVTNNQKQPSALRSFSVEIADKGTWRRLVDAPPRIPDRVYMPGPDASLAHAARLNFRGRAFSTAEPPPQMQPGQTVKGWAFFLFPAGYKGGCPSECRFRVTVDDALGSKATAEISPAIVDVRSLFFGHGSEPFYVTGDQADVSGLPLAVPEYLLPAFRAQQTKFGGDGGVRLQPVRK